MRLLKSEHEARYKCGDDAGRDDVSMHPELLCDHDILMWRQEKNWSRSPDSGGYGDIDSVRINDYDPPTRDQNTRNRSFTKVRNLIHRTFN